MPIKHNTLSDEVDLIADEQWDENHDISTLTLDEIGEGSTNKAFTSTLKSKLDGIAAGAEVNVNADWNASSGDAQILNKPTIPVNSDFSLNGLGEKSYNNLTDKPTIPTTTADISDSSNKRYVTDAQLTVIGNTSGTNTGDQNLSGYFNKSADDLDDITEGSTNKAFTSTLKTKLDGIQAGAQVNNISDANATDLTDGGVTSLHSHALASGVNWGNTLVAVLADNVSTAADTNPVDLTGMVFTFEANSKYIMQFFGAVSPAANSTGEGFQINVSAAVTSVWHHHFHQSANTGAIIGGTSVADDASVSVSSGTPATGTWTTSGFGVLVTGANTGTAQLRFRAEVNAVTTCVAGSIWIVTKVA
jgi:hypothetical protein